MCGMYGVSWPRQMQGRTWGGGNSKISNGQPRQGYPLRVKESVGRRNSPVWGAVRSNCEIQARSARHKKGANV